MQISAMFLALIGDLLSHRCDVVQLHHRSMAYLPRFDPANHVRIFHGCYYERPLYAQLLVVSQTLSCRADIVCT